jgi:hypothetical protein
MVRAGRTALALFSLGLVALPIGEAARADVVTFTADLSASAEVPSNPSPAKGSAEVRLDTATGGLSWVIEFSGMSGPLTAAHFHGPASPTANAGILVPIARAGARSPLVGGSTLAQPQIQELLAGRWYINLHTASYPGGEIRGQVTKK